MNGTLRQFRDFFVSLRLTVVLLALSIILIFAATLDQVNLGVWAVQHKYFQTFFVLWKFGEVPVPVFPGGYFIGGLLFANLIAAHLYRFKLTWRKAGIFLTHLGVILLLLGELLSGLWQEDYNMRIEEGETKNYAESYQFYELAITDTTNADFDDVVVIPKELLERGEVVQHPKLPFRVVPKAFFPNVNLERRSDAPNAPPSLATTGAGPGFAVTPIPFNYKPDAVNMPVAYVELVAPEGTLGTWLTTYLSPQILALPMAEGIKPIVYPQTFSYGGHSWKIALRPQRAYKPFALTLLKFSHDVYAGTDIPKNFSSRIHLTTPDGRDDREVLIYMNNPLRYAGLTFFQSGYDGEHITVLQVVRNPSWRLPYIACILMAVGLVVQFGIHLFGFFRKRRADSVPAAA
jgi:hypothetical protein